MARTEMRLRDDDGDAAFMLGIAEAELYANGELQGRDTLSNVQLVNNGVARYMHGRRQEVVPDMGFITLRSSLPPVLPPTSYN